MSDVWIDLFGSGNELSALQMSCRAIVVFAATLVLIRVAGRRSFGMHSAFDACMTVLLGAVLSRAVVGASPFVPTLCAGLALSVAHRLIGLASVRFQAFERLISGDERTMLRDGRMDRRAMYHALVTERDLREAARKRTGSDDLDSVDRVILERNGEITVITRRLTRNRTFANPGARSG
ncbi:MAG: DUF421 domain-containing protein [Proteobacteria bacterium]|nr:DUF421 domain-containing protein [Pseudomonadota bacterium]